MPDQAIKHFEEALQYSSSFPEAQLGLGIALYQAKQYAEAEKQLAQLLAKSPQAAVALDYYGLSLLKLGQLNQAVSCFEKLVEVQPQCAEGLQHLGDAYAASGKMSLAKTFWEQAKKLTSCRDQFGQVVQIKGQPVQAKKEKLVQSPPGNFKQAMFFGTNSKMGHWAQKW